MKNESTYHKPIMVDEIKNFLNPSTDKVYLDCTLGGGGHTEMMLQVSSPNGKVYGIDKDEDAIKFASQRLIEFGDRFIPIRCDYRNAVNELKNLGVQSIDGALLDLGVSSFQLDNFDRGFSYRSKESPLDMRMDKSQSFSAYDVVNTYSIEDLTRIFNEYGEEKFSNKIAKEIDKRRSVEKISNCGELVEIIENTIPKKFQQDGHPAKRVFQAIRIEVNGEIANLEKSVLDIIRFLKPNGRICVITFHSLEDRIIKNLFRELEKDCICDKSLPVCVCDKIKEVEILTKKPITANEEELKNNPRAKSAKLRACEKVDESDNPKVRIKKRSVE